MNDSVCYSHTIIFVRRKLGINQMKNNILSVLLNNVIQHVNSNKKNDFTLLHIIKQSEYQLSEGKGLLLYPLNHLNSNQPTYGRHLYSHSFL